MWNHWVARASTPYEPFKDFENARSTWTLLSKNFPDALAAVLMPNHLHIILPKNTEHLDRKRLLGLLGSVSRRLKRHALWQPLPPPASIPDRHHLKRQIRYIALNPCRSGLCSDPVEWVWSTYRDLIGSCAHPWTRRSQIIKALAENERGFDLRFHSYVSGDPSVAVQGTPFPLPAIATPHADRGILEILTACSAALRVQTSNAKRKGPLRPLFIHMARQSGWNKCGRLSELCGITPRAVQLILKQKAPVGMKAAMLCLGDERLRRFANFAKGEVTGRSPHQGLKLRVSRSYDCFPRLRPKAARFAKHATSVHENHLTASHDGFRIK
jgi:hypothetical protein